MPVLDYWWVTRPKRRLNSVPEELAAFASVALNQPWRGNREAHLAFEEALESSEVKRIGERRDQSGSGGRTHASWLSSLGLWFEQKDCVFLTLAGQAILDGGSAFEVLKKQVLTYQFPSKFSIEVGVSPRFKIHPFVFLLRLLRDERISFLTQDEIAFVVILEAENESKKCFEEVVSRILQYRECEGAWITDDYLSYYNSSRSKLSDIANTFINWLDYTRLVFRERVESKGSKDSIVRIADDCIDEVERILENPPTFIKITDDPVIFQRKYGVSPWRQKDTRNLLKTSPISTRSIEKARILKEFFKLSSLKPLCKIDSVVVETISQLASTEYAFTEDILNEAYPHGAIGGFLTEYRDMAFKGRDEAIDFEKATVNLFHDVFDYQTNHIGQSGGKSSPDILLLSDKEGYQAILDNKAYSRYSISGDHFNRMLYNYIGKLSSYSSSLFPLAFFSYISGGFATNFDAQIARLVKESGVKGSGISIYHLIELVEKHLESPLSHSELRRIFSVGRQIKTSDI